MSKHDAEKQCVFCEIAAGRSPATFVHRDDTVMAFLDIAPIAPGHLLVVPVAHAVVPADIDDITGARMFSVARSLAVALRESELRCDAVNLFLADGISAGQVVFHAHIHVLPRFSGDRLPLYFAHHGSPSRGELEAVGHMIRAVVDT